MKFLRGSFLWGACACSLMCGIFTCSHTVLGASEDETDQIYALINERKAFLEKMEHDLPNFSKSIRELLNESVNILDQKLNDPTFIAETAQPLLEKVPPRFTPYSYIRAQLISAAIQDSLSLATMLPKTAKRAFEDPRIIGALERWCTLSRTLLSKYPLDETSLFFWSMVEDADYKLSEKLLPLFERKFGTRGVSVLVETVQKDLRMRYYVGKRALSENELREVGQAIQQAARSQQKKLLIRFLKKGGPFLRMLPPLATGASASELSACIANEQGKPLSNLSTLNIAKCGMAQSLGFLFELVSLSFNNQAQAAEDMDEATAQAMLAALQSGSLCAPATSKDEPPWCYPPQAFAKLIVRKPAAATALLELSQYTASEPLKKTIEGIFTAYAAEAGLQKNRAVASSPQVLDLKKMMDALRTPSMLPLHGFAS